MHFYTYGVKGGLGHYKKNAIIKLHRKLKKLSKGQYKASNFEKTKAKNAFTARLLPRSCWKVEHGFKILVLMGICNRQLL